MSGCGCLRFAPDDRFCQAFGLGAAALVYAGTGYAVLPLQRGGKRPHRMLGDRGGVRLATTDRGLIQYWWTLDKAANIGVACGSPSRLAVVDMDVKHGTDGPRSFWDFCHGSQLPFPWRDFPAAMTPSGGWHAWLRVPEGARVPDRPGILPGVDVKGDGGYVVAAPSMLLVQPMARPGEQGGAEVPVPYEWRWGCPHTAPPAPEWMGYWLMSAPASGSQHGGAEQEGEGGGSYDPGELARTGIPEGRRNRTVYVLACSLYRRMGTGPAESAAVVAKLREVWEATSHRDFTWQEVLTSAESARRFVERAKAADMSVTRSYLETLRYPWQQ